QQVFTETYDSVDRTAIDELTRSVKFLPSFPCAPFSSTVEILQTKPDWVHHPVTTRAGWICPMFFHSLPHRLRTGSGIGFQRRHIGRRIRRVRTQKIFEHPFATQDGRGPVRVRRNQLHAAFSEQSTADIEFAWQIHTTELRAVYVRYSVMRGQTFI